MKLEIVGDHTFIVGDKMFKSNGKVFSEYHMIEGAWSLQGEKEKARVFDSGIHKIDLYHNGNVGIRVMLHSDYKAKPDYIVYPIMYSNGQIAYDYPERVPVGQKFYAERLMHKLRRAGVL